MASCCARQQVGGIPTVGVLWHAGSPEGEAPFFGALLEGFKGLGYVDGQNIRLVHRFPNEIPENFRSMVAELVALNVDVFVSVAPASFYAKDAVGAIPHVFLFVPDPVGSKFVESLARPGGNATGLSGFTTGLTGKRVQLMREAVPGLTSLGLLVNPAIQVARTIIEEAQAAAVDLRVSLQIFEATTLDGLERAFDAMARAGVQGLTVSPQALFFVGRAMLSKLALDRRLPTSVHARELMDAGAFMSYGPSLAAIVPRVPSYVDRILKGAKPAELPVEQPTRFELVINMRTAKAIGVDVLPMLLARADEVIE
jgi:putative ABC transport system substrate-binding protein